MSRRSVVLSFSGLHAQVIPDGFSDTGYILEIGGAEQSHVDLVHPEHIFYEYLRRIANVIDVCAPTGQPIKAAHLGAGALTLVRYIAVTRPGSAQVAVDIERELPSFVLEQLPLPAQSNCKVLIADARAVLPDLEQALVQGGGQSELPNTAPAQNNTEPEQGIDAIVLDIFSGWDAPEHLTQESYYRELRQLLAPKGSLCVNVGDDAGLTFFTAQARTMLQVFEHVWCLAETTLLGGKHAGNLILVGTSKPLDESTKTALHMAGPHPGSVLGTAEVQDLVRELLHQAARK